jgi:membrane-associated phospholipid phosphatase
MDTDLLLRVARRMAPHRLLTVTLTIGLILVAGLTALAASIYDAVVEADGIAGLDQPVLDAAVANRTATGTRIISAYTKLGGPVELPILATIAALTLALSWRRWTPIVLIAVTGLGSVILTVVGKVGVERVRPPLEDAVAPFEHSYSFPSGHSLNSIALAGIVAYLIIGEQQRPAARAVTVSLAAAFALTMGLSRVYLGQHWLTDVLVAWMLGLAWLSVVITTLRLYFTVYTQRTGPWRHRRPRTADRRLSPDRRILGTA